MMMRIIKSFIGLSLIASMMGQESTYLAQKLMLENDLRSRIEAALQKIMDDHRYVLDVTVDLKFTPTVTEEVTFRPAGSDDAKSAVRSGREESSRSVPLTSESPEPRSRMTGIPIPGFDFQSMEDEEPTESVVVEEPSETPTMTEGPSKGSQILSQSYKDTKASVPVVERLEVSCILPEGSAPELIENVRQIIMVASHFDRSRGDVLSVMTASFRQRKDERTAESIILRSIAEKIDQLEEKQADAEAQVADDWRQELELWKADEARRRDEERNVWQTELESLENNRIAREFENERQTLLERDSLRMNQLTTEIAQLREVLSEPQLSEEEQEAAEEAVASKEDEKEALDSLIEEKLAMLEQAQKEMESMGGGMSNLPIYLMSAISLLAVLALAAVILFNGRSKPKYVMPPPWMMQPPKKKVSSNGNGAAVASATAAPPAPVAPAPAAPPQASAPPAFEEDPSVLQSEMTNTRESVVSMSVGDPNVATAVVQDWLEQEAPPAPEPAEAAPSAQAAPEEAEDDGGKKKKKKKK